MSTTTAHWQSWSRTDCAAGCPVPRWGGYCCRNCAAHSKARAGACRKWRCWLGGRLPLAYSARCFTARALDLPKDQCGFRCIEHPDGLPLATREGEPFLTINGIQVQGTEVIDMAPERDALAACGVGVMRISPQAEGTADIVARFRRILDAPEQPEAVGARNGYWHGQAGKASLSTAQAAGNPEAVA